MSIICKLCKTHLVDNYEAWISCTKCYLHVCTTCCDTICGASPYEHYDSQHPQARYRLNPHMMPNEKKQLDTLSDDELLKWWKHGSYWGISFKNMVNNREYQYKLPNEKLCTFASVTNNYDDTQHCTPVCNYVSTFIFH